MSFLGEAEPSAARDELYADDVARQGYVANYTRVSRTGPTSIAPGSR